MKKVSLTIKSLGFLLVKNEYSFDNVTDDEVTISQHSKRG